MPSTYKTPGVYVEEISKFPPSVAQVATAIPAFIGYTERASNNGESLTLVPTEVDSLVEYEEKFGSGPPLDLTVVLDPSSSVDTLSSGVKFYMYDSLRMFFDNGGGKCYIISIGSYQDNGGNTTTIAKQDFLNGLAALEKEDEPTIILAPDATLINEGTTTDVDLYDFQQKALAQCAKLQDRVSICDLKSPVDSSFDFDDTVDQFRNNIGINDLKYGAAYAPWIKSSLPRTIRYRDIQLQRPASTDIPFNALTTDPAVLQLLFELDSAILSLSADSGGSDTFDGLKTAYNNILTASGTNTTTMAELANALMEVYYNAVPGYNPGAPDNHDYSYFTASLQALAQMAMDMLASVKGVYDTLPTKPIPPNGPSPATNTSNTFTLRDDMDLLINSSGLSSVMQTLLENHAGSAAAAVPVALVIDDATTQSGLDMVYPPDASITLGNMAANLPGFTVVDYDALADDPARATAAANAISAALSTISSFFESVLAAAEGYESTFDKSLAAQFAFYKNLQSKISGELNTLPPSGAIAGVYAKVDRERGVWKAPANVSLSSVVGPSVKISHSEQEDLNVDVNAGKSINAIRTFSGKGILVWGARTLAGNDNEWRYVPVRRFFNMAEESIKKATEQFVFEPNDANTWVKVKAMIENFLLLQWRAGALAGAKPEQAFFVKVGLGETMTSLDILEGRMIVEIGMAVVRPAEFIILKFSHKMQES